MTIRGERGVIATVGADEREVVVSVDAEPNGHVVVLRLSANHARAFETAVRAARLEVEATAVSP